MSKSNGIFISYRRDGGDGLAGRVRDALTKRGYKAFLDVEDLKTGRFNEALLAEIDRCTDFVVILSVGALDRCVNEGDWVRREIAHALKQQKNIVPVIGRNFHFPKELPADINDLRHYNGIGASHDLFEASMDKLAGNLRCKPKTRTPKTAVFLAVAVAIAAIAFFVRPHGNPTPEAGKQAPTTSGVPADPSPVTGKPAVPATGTPPSVPDATVTFGREDFVPRFTLFTSMSGASAPSWHFILDVSPRAAAANTVREFSYSLDGKNFKKSPTMGYLMIEKAFDQKELHLQLGLWGGETIGPFTYPVDFNRLALDAMKEALSNVNWVTNSGTQYLLQNVLFTNLPAVKRIECSTNPDFSDAKFMTGTTESLEAYLAKPENLRKQNAPMPMPMSSRPMHFRIRFHDGEVGPTITLVPGVRTTAPGLVDLAAIQEQVNRESAQREATAKMERLLGSARLEPASGSITKWRFGAELADLPGTVRAIHLGEKEDQLDLTYHLPGTKKAWLESIDRLAVRRGAQGIFYQFEKVDGTMSPVRRLEAKPGRADGIGARLPVIEGDDLADAPVLFVDLVDEERTFYSGTRPGAAGLRFRAAGPHYAKSWKFAMEDIHFPDAVDDTGSWVGQAILRDINIPRQRIQVAWVDEEGRSHGPYTYSTEGISTLRFENLKQDLLAVLPKQFVFYVVPLPPTSSTQNLQALADYHKRLGIEFVNDYGIWVAAGSASPRAIVDARSSAFVLGGPSSPAWGAATEVRLGFAPERLDQVVTLASAAIGRKAWVARLDGTHDHVYAQVIFADGTKSDVLRFPVAKMQTVVWEPNNWSTKAAMD